MPRWPQQPPQSDGSIWIAKDSFTTELAGAPITVIAGQTRVRDGHPLLVAHGQFFERLKVHYEVEQATAAPGEQRAR